MSIASAIQTLTNTIRGIATTKGQIKSAVNTDFEAIQNEQIEQYPSLIRNAINQYKSYIPVVTGEGKQISLNTVPLKPKEFALIGDTEQATRILPEGYTQLDYIESTGTQYIDTGINADSNLRVVLDIAYTDPSGSNQNIGAINLPSGNNIRYHILSQAGYMKIYLQSSTQVISTITADTDRHYYDIDAPNKTVLVDNNTYTVDISNFDTELNFWLFARNSTSTKYYCKCKLWASKMYYNGVLVRDFIPCKNPNNEVGLYDLVSKTFFSNQGTGDFTAGNEVQIPNPDYPQDIKVVTGSQTVVKNGKNFIPTQVEKWEQGAITTAEGTNSDNTTRVRTIDYYPIQELTNYYLSVEDATYCFVNLFLYDNNKNYITNYYAITHSISGATSLAVNFPTNTAYYRAVMRNKANSSAVIEPSVILTAKPMLALGTTKTDYEPYNGVQLPLSLGIMELCKIEDYKDYLYKENGNWYKHKAINKNTYNGTENWTRYYNSTRGGGFYIPISDGIGGSPCLCNKFTNDNGHALWFGEVGTFRISDTLNAGFKTTPAGTEPVTKEQWQSELSTSNLILYYPLATPVTEQITDTTLISQLEAIENTNMNNGTTIIYAENEEGLQPTLYMEAYKKIEEEN